MNLRDRLRQLERHAGVVRCPSCGAAVSPQARTLEHPVDRLRRANDRMARLLGVSLDPTEPVKPVSTTP